MILILLLNMAFAEVDPIKISSVATPVQSALLVKGLYKFMKTEKMNVSCKEKVRLLLQDLETGKKYSVCVERK